MAKTTEEIEALFEAWVKAEKTEEEKRLGMFGRGQFLSGYRTAEAESQAEIERLRGELRLHKSLLADTSGLAVDETMRANTAEAEIERLRQENTVAWENSRTSRAIAEKLQKQVDSLVEQLDLLGGDE